jgi:DNA repair exonuclease SbcCD nuclease subunit
MKAWLLGDVHLHNTTADLVCRLVDYIIDNTEDEEYLIIAGDWFHKATRQSVETLVVSKNLLNRLNSKFKVIMLAGNHDVTKRDIDFRYSPLSIYDYHKLVLNEPVLIDNIWFVPYTSRQEQWNIWTSNIPKKAEVVVAHQFFKDISKVKHKYLWFPFKEISDIELPYTDVIETRLELPILSGHIHIPYNFGSFMYLGSPYPLKRNEGNKHYIYKFDSGRKKLEPIQMGLVEYAFIDKLDKKYNNPRYILFIKTDLPEDEVREFYSKARQVNIEKIQSVIQEAKNIELTTATDLINNTIELSNYTDEVKDKVKRLIFGG